MKRIFKWLGRLIVIIILLGIGLTVYSLLAPPEPPATAIHGGYALVKENSRSAYIIQQTEGGKQDEVVPSIIISYAVDGDYIAAKQTEVPASEDVKPDFTTYSYWLIDTKDGKIYGPIDNEADFTTKCTELDLSFEEWLGT